jgi:DNA gyrase/topoisomerase IV subunit B
LIKYGNIKKDNYEIIIKANDTDDFEFLSIVNGLYTKNGGTHIDYILNQIIPPIREKLSKKYKTIKPADIKNKLKLYINIRFVKNLQFDSQTKERITNNINIWKEVFKTVNWEKIVNLYFFPSKITIRPCFISSG